MSIDRGVRTKPSSPIRFLTYYGWLYGKDILVFGGNEYDVKHIQASREINSSACRDDFCTAPDPVPVPHQSYDVVIVPFVLDAIAPHERTHALETARSFVRPDGIVYVATRKYPKGGYRFNGKLEKQIELPFPLFYDGEDYRLWCISNRK